MKLINIAIDSATILVPYDQFLEFPQGIFDEYIEINSDTAEELTKTNKPIVNEFNGIKTRASLFHIINKRYVAITINSKMLRGRYLEGITFKNFPHIREYLEFTLKCKFYPNFIDYTLVFDCDFKGDFFQDISNYSEMLRGYSKCAGAKLYYSKKVSYLEAKQVSGLQFVNRNDASIRTPFVKIYDKHDELLNNSYDFYDNYIRNKVDNLQLKDLKRLEVTVRNKEHFKALKIESTLLKDVLFLSSATIKEIIKTLLFKHIEYYQPVSEEKIYHKNRLCMPKDYLCVQMIIILMQENNYSLAQCLQLLDSFPGLTDNTKSNIKRTLKDSFKKVIDYKEILTSKITLKDAFL